MEEVACNNLDGATVELSQELRVAANVVELICSRIRFRMSDRFKRAVPIASGVFVPDLSAT